MATIKVNSEGRTFECALNFALINDNMLFVASYAGQPSAVWAISACATEGRRITVIDDDDRRYELFTNAGMYRRVERKVGEIWHGMIIHKHAVYYENCQMPVIVAPNGDVKTAVGKFIVSKFAVPSEWENDYIRILNYKRLWAVTSSAINAWNKIEAVRITGVMPGMDGLTEENLLQGIEKALKKGFLKIPETEAKGSFDPSWTARDYLKANAKVLAEQVKQVKPRHDFGKKLDPAIAQMERIPFSAQAHVVQGLVNALKHEDMVIACGDMGTGKSIISLGVCNVLNKRKKGMAVLISSPGIMVPKWEKIEIAETLPDAKIYTIRSTEDAARYLRMVREGYKPEGLEFVLVGIDRAKLGPDPWCSAIWKEIHPGSIGTRLKRTHEFAWHCPSCM
ncbi:MAG: hypothetical protein K6U74_18895 [Firmicutes bacterium]|nr:hypothetical protein [Bacillota bacterium]